MIAKAGASVKDIYHERSWLQYDPVHAVECVLSVELTGPEHKVKLREAMQAAIDSKRVHSWGNIKL